MCHMAAVLKRKAASKVKCRIAILEAVQYFTTVTIYKISSDLISTIYNVT